MKFSQKIHATSPEHLTDDKLLSTLCADCVTLCLIQLEDSGCGECLSTTRGGGGEGGFLK